jgi:hypothetical protein
MGMEQSMYETNTEQVESIVQNNLKTDWNSISQVDGTEQGGTGGQLDTNPVSIHCSAQNPTRMAPS